MATVHRRTFLATTGLTGLLALTACTRDRPTEEGPMGDERITYGDDPSQYVEISRPEGTSRGTVVIIHGGFWKAAYDASLGRPLAASLRDEGWTAANVEYRRVGNGGGVPQTLDDVAAAIDALADVEGVDTTNVITLGHSAGGHLAVWAAARGRFERWQPARVTVTAAVSQAGVLDLGAGYDADLGGGAVGAFVGVGARPGLRRGGPAPAAPPRRPGALHPRHRRRHRPDQPVARLRRRRGGGRCRRDPHRGRRR